MIGIINNCTPKGGWKGKWMSNIWDENKVGGKWGNYVHSFGMIMEIGGQNNIYPPIPKARQACKNKIKIGYPFQRKGKLARR